MDWISIEEFNEEKHGKYFAAIMDKENPENIIMVTYFTGGDSSKWWTSFPDGELRTCGIPYQILVCDCENKNVKKQ